MLDNGGPDNRGSTVQLSSRREKRWSCVQGCLFSSITKTCYVAMPTGYKLVITRALGMHGTYCTQPSGLTPSCFSAIYAIHPSCPCYNYNINASCCMGLVPIPYTPPMQPIIINVRYGCSCDSPGQHNQRQLIGQEFHQGKKHST